MLGRKRNEEIISDKKSTLVGPDDGWGDAPIWDAEFLAKVQANFHSLTAVDVKDLTPDLRQRPEEIAAQGVALAARLDALSAERGSAAD